ncbi:hypothetical protein I6E81_11700 [Salinibacterium sp. NG22]|uniref:hypothetical protein n=1 Tax=Salinibacterium sp. NG22 TaxID=2792040 RepID=UPI0018CD99D2|nr:hypothetical protein [Salinibacterium sp. NG22]MBH0110833.1 hypothetical protein [Salinibacterium sp. NG22]
MDECHHGMDPAWCATCSNTDDTSASRSDSHGFHGGETKQDVLNDVTRMLGMRSRQVSVGSSLPSDVFAAAALRVGVAATGSMPEVLERIVAKAGHEYHSNFDSRGSLSGGGSTVTLEGIQALRSTLRTLL